APRQQREPTAGETELGVPWPGCLATGAGRVLTAGEEAEGQRVAQLTQAAAPFLSQVFEMAIEIQPGWTSYLLANQGEHLPFLEHHPAINSSFREFLQNVVGTAIPGRPQVVYWDHSSPHRIDGSSRQAIQDCLHRVFGIGFDHGWAWEGFGLYLNRELCGTRLTWFIQMGNSGKWETLRARLMVNESNWMNEAFNLLGQPDHPHFDKLLVND